MNGRCALFILLSVSPAICANSLRVSGVVSDSKTHLPIDGAVVSATGDQSQETVPTDVNGIFVLPLRPGINPGDTIQLHVQKKGYRAYEENVAVSTQLPRPILLVPLRNNPSRTGKQAASRRSGTADSPKIPVGELTPPKVTVNAYLEPGPRPDGFAFAGIVWDKEFSDVRLDISVEKAPIHNLDFLLALDTTIMGVGQITQFSGCTAFPPQGNVSGIELLGTDTQGNKTSIPVEPTPGNVNASAVYRIHCDEVLAGTVMRFAAAARALNSPNPDGTFPDHLFAPHRDPDRLRVRGSYESGGNIHPFQYSVGFQTPEESKAGTSGVSNSGQAIPPPVKMGATDDISSTSALTSINREREYTKRSPRELLALYNNVTALQAESLMEPFKGVWIRVTGSVQTIVDAGRGAAQILLNDREGTTCVCTFTQEWRNRLQRLSKNDDIDVVGRISNGQNGVSLFLSDCELRESSELLPK